jgi:hypothetical protein
MPVRSVPGYHQGKTVSRFQAQLGGLGTGGGTPTVVGVRVTVTLSEWVADDVGYPGAPNNTVGGGTGYGQCATVVHNLGNEHAHVVAFVDVPTGFIWSGYALLGQKADSVEPTNKLTVWLADLPAGNVEFLVVAC